jgi:hypothetical protein
MSGCPWRTEGRAANLATIHWHSKVTRLPLPSLFIGGRERHQHQFGPGRSPFHYSRTAGSHRPLTTSGKKGGKQEKLSEPQQEIVIILCQETTEV